MKKYIILTLVAVMIFLCTACGGRDKKQTAVDIETGTETSGIIIETETAEAVQEPVYTIPAFGLELKYPEKWKDKVNVTVTDDKAEFSCGEVKLFDLLVNSEQGFVLGTVCGDEYKVISVVDYPAESADTDVPAMKEALDTILNNLSEDYDFVIGEALEKEDSSTFDIETPVVTMKYPAKWKDRVQIDVSDEAVRFSDGSTPLFDLMFRECDGYLLGTYNGTPIYIIDYEITTDDQAAMQENVNVILEHLMEDKNFTIAS